MKHVDDADKCEPVRNCSPEHGVSGGIVFVVRGFTGSQWRFFSTGVMCSHLSQPTTKRDAHFCTLCKWGAAFSPYLILSYRNTDEHQQVDD